jgi:hypothetical protein
VRFIITTSPGREGVRLSRPGHFGNLPLDDDAAAVREAKRIADGRPFTIERKRSRK